MALFFQNLLNLSLEAAPWLVLGLTLGGLMKALIPTAFLERHLKGSDLGSITKATLLGAPLPLCSCGVIPAALGLRKAGASKPATTAFLVSTPETGVDSISITYALMGPFMAVVRPIAALFSAIAAGLLVALFDAETSSEKPKSAPVTCCGCEPQKTPASEPGCCAHESPPAPNLAGKAWEGIRYAFTSLLDDIVFWLVIGMLFAASTKTFLPVDFLAQWGQGIAAMLVMLLAGIPMYICATASTPVAAGLMMAGVSPGVALVLLLTGPATNISTLGVIGRELGWRTMWIYLASVGVTAILAGLIVDEVVSSNQLNIPAQLQHAHSSLPVWLEWGTLLLLVAIALRSFLLPRSNRSGEEHHHPA
jgi:hypothetical protein